MMKISLKLMGFAKETEGLDQSRWAYLLPGGLGLEN